MEFICPNCEYPIVVTHEHKHEKGDTCCPACKQIITMPDASNELDKSDDVKDSI